MAEVRVTRMNHSDYGLDISVEVDADGREIRLDLWEGSHSGCALYEGTTCLYRDAGRKDARPSD